MKKLLIVLVLLLGLSAAFGEYAAAASPPELPDVAFVEGLVGHGQTYPLSCESRSASDLAGYWGLDVPEVGFFNNLPVSDNPEKGFVGSVYGTWGQTPPNPYGVHAKPVAKLLRQYGLDATAQRGMTVADLKAEIAAGRPVIVWIIGHVWKGTPIEYKADDGSTVIVAQYEHTMIAYGYDLAGIYLMDAGNGARKNYSYGIFKESWAVLGNMAVTAVGEVQLKPETPLPNGGEGQYVVKPGDYLSKLAKDWGVSWQDLAALNDIYFPYTIYPGQVLFTIGKDDSKNNEQNPEPTAKPKPTKEPVATATPKPTEPGTPWVYVVQSGDHLMKIARSFNVSWETLAKLNDLSWPYILYPGQKLDMPDGTKPEGAQKTPEPPEKQDDKEEEKEQKAKTYKVLRGEHLMQIARKLELSWQAIAQMNNLSAPYLLFPGQVLKLPGPEAGPPPPPLVEESEVEDVSEYSGTTYVVKKGDYLYALAQKFGLNWQKLATYNDIGYPYVVYPGQVLKIP